MDAKTKTNGNAELEAVREDIAALKEDLASLMQHLKSGGGSFAQDAASRLHEKAGAFYEDIGERGHRSAEAVRHRVEERPLTAIAIAFALGYIGGRLLSR